MPFAVAAAAGAFAMANGLQYGRSNHWQYLLHGLHEADPSFLANDWFTTQTAAHHGLFAWFVRAAAWSGRPNVVIGLANGAMSALFVVCLYALAARFAKRAAVAFALLLAMAAYVTVDSVGHSNILLPYFVPSVFGGVALVAALVLWSYGYAGWAGLVAAVGCAWHANYWVLVGPLWAIVLVVDRSPAKLRTAARLLVPWAVSVLPHVPFFIERVRDMTPTAAAAHVFFDVYASMHYRPLTWAASEWVRFGGWLAAGALAAWIARARFDRRCAAVVIGLIVIVAGGGVGSIIGAGDSFAAFYTWRLAPFLMLASFTAVAVAVTVLLERFGNLVGGGGASPASAHSERVGRAVDVTGWAAVLVLAALLTRAGLWRKDMFGVPYKPAEASLYSWVRENTPSGTVFIIPPDMAPFRLETGRAVVVDWKCMPLMPRDQVEWARRHERHAGHAVSSLEDALTAYDGMTAQAAMSLAGEFGATYIVTRRERHRGDLTPCEQVFSNDRFEVRRVSAARP